MIVILKESCCLYQSPHRLDSINLFYLFSCSTAPLSFLACIVSVEIILKHWQVVNGQLK